MNLSDFIKQVKDWLNRPEYSDALVTSWVRMAEQDLSKRLRIEDMIQIDTAVVIEDRVALPPDWEQSDFVRVVGGGPLEFKSRDEFYRSGFDRKGFYTITGRYLMVGGKPSGTNEHRVELSYYGSIPPLGNQSNFMTTRYLQLFTASVVALGEAYGLDDQRAATMITMANSLVDAVNVSHINSKASGSILRTRSRKGFS